MGKSDRFDTSNSRTADEILSSATVSPVFPVTDIQATATHYERLGFSIEVFPGAGYGFVRAGSAEIQLKQVPDLDPSTSTSVCYLYVEDADVIYEKWENADIVGRFIPPSSGDGIREFGHVDLDGNLIRVASSLA